MHYNIPFSEFEPSIKVEIVFRIEQNGISFFCPLSGRSTYYSCRSSAISIPLQQQVNDHKTISSIECGQLVKFLHFIKVPAESSNPDSVCVSDLTQIEQDKNLVIDFRIVKILQESRDEAIKMNVCMLCDGSPTESSGLECHAQNV